MKPAYWVLILTMVLSLTLVVTAQLPQKDQPQAGQQLDPDRFEAAHDALTSSQDKGKEASRLTEAVAASLPDTEASFAPVPRKNFIDEHIFGRIERDHIPHAPLAGDEEFLRRVYLDATGRLPEPAVVREFIASKDPQKRDKLIDSLIGTDEFTEQWAWFFGDLFQNQKDNA